MILCICLTKINDFYTGNKYSKTNPWIEIHRQVEEFVTDTNYSFELHNQIIEFTKKWDEKRKLDWRLIFPEIVNYFT